MHEICAVGNRPVGFAWRDRNKIIQMTDPAFLQSFGFEHRIDIAAKCPDLGQKQNARETAGTHEIHNGPPRKPAMRELAGSIVLCGFKLPLNRSC